MATCKHKNTKKRIEKTSMGSCTYTECKDCGADIAFSNTSVIDGTRNMTESGTINNNVATTTNVDMWTGED